MTRVPESFRAYCQSGRAEAGIRHSQRIRKFEYPIIWIFASSAEFHLSSELAIESFMPEHMGGKEHGHFTCKPGVETSIPESRMKIVAPAPSDSSLMYAYGFAPDAPA